MTDVFGDLFIQYKNKKNTLILRTFCSPSFIFAAIVTNFYHLLQFLVIVDLKSLKKILHISLLSPCNFTCRIQE